MTAERPYLVCLYVGPSPLPKIDVETVVDLTPADPSADAILERLRASGLTPADLRSRVVFMVDPSVAAEVAVAVYSAVLGFAGRRVDIACGEDLVVAEDLDESVRRMPDAGRPEVLPDHVQVGPVAHPELPHVGVAAPLGPNEVTLVRYARRVRFVPTAAAQPALTQLVVIAGLRARGDNDRLPFLCVGDEPAPTPETATDPVGLCLDTLRRDAMEIRRSLRGDNRDSLAPAVDLSVRQQRLLAAAELPIEETLTRLGAACDASTGLWHCPRPERHTNGDKNASTRVVKGKVRCFRCDQERLDSLRLVMDVLTASADEAADWLLSGAPRPAVAAAA